MKKTAGLFASFILIACFFTACSSASAPEYSNTYAASESQQQEMNAVISDGPSLTPMKIEFSIADRGRIIPNITEYNEDLWEKEKDTSSYGFITIDGEYVCDSLFDLVSFNEDADSYLVRRTENGEAKYGMISSDGSKFTGLIFDGASTAQGVVTGNAVYYGSNYSDGYLWVTGVDSDLNILDSKEIKIDENQIGLNAKTSQLTVLYTNKESSVIINKSEFYYKTMLIDNNTGELLYSFNSFGSSCKIFGNLIIEQDISGKGIAVYDMSGFCLLKDKSAMSGMVSSDTYMAVINGTVNLYDKDWNVVKKLDVPDSVDVMTSFGRIAVVFKDKTCVYDEDFTLINTLDYSVGGGTYFRDWYDSGEGNMYYDSISGTKEIINLTTGAKLNKQEGFHYSNKYGLIIADNISNGNDPQKKWFIYDKNLKEIAKGEGTADVIRDLVTGDVYFVTNKDNVMTVFSMPENKKLFSFKFTCSNLCAANGRFYGWTKEHFLLCDGEGKELCSYNIKYNKKSEI